MLISLCVPVLLSGQNAEQEIRTILSEQADAWNAGDIEQFMKTYWPSDRLQFLSATGLTSGWNGTLDRYRKRYPDRKAMVQLQFTLKDITKRSKKVYTVIGRYDLERQGMDDLSGYFMLVFQKIKGDWFIVADSTH